MPRVSIVIPVRNRESLLGQTLESVRDQTFEDWECIVVDDHSTDGSVAAARRCAGGDTRFRIVSLAAGKRNGNAARNHGLSLVRGGFVNFLDSDDLITRNKLKVQLAAFESNPELDIVTCRHAIFETDPETDARQVTFAQPVSWLDVVWLPSERSSYGGTWCSIGPLWRAEFIRSIGAWDESIEVWQDSELHVRALCSTSKILRLEQILVFVRVGEHPRLSSPNADWGRQRRHAVRTAWKHVRQSGQVTRLRQRMCALRLYAIAYAYANGELWKSGLRGWLDDCNETGMNGTWKALGWLRLVAEHYRFLRPVSWLLRPAFRAHRRQLPPALPDLESVPLKLPGAVLITAP